MNRRDLLAGAGLASVALTLPASAQSLAGKTVTIIFNFATGGSGDASARLIAEKLRTALNATFIVDNKTGAAGRIGINAVKNAKPDGTTLLYTPFAPMTLFVHSYTDLGYDPFKDFKPIAITGTNDFGLVVNADAPVKNMAEFIDWMKKNPDKNSYGSPGAGTLPHFMGVSLAKITGLPLAHVTYRGSAAAMNDLIGGHVPFVITTTSDFVGHVKSGKVRAIATSDKARSPFLDGVATFKEQGINLEGVGWYGLFAPAGTPDAVIDELTKAAMAAVKSPDVAEKFRAMGLDPLTFDAKELAARQKADSEQWGPTIKASGFTPEQ